MICTLSNIRIWHDCFQSVFSHAEKEGKRKQKPGGRFNSHRVADSRHSCPLLQVGLSIQVGCLYVTHTVGVWCVKQEEVCRNDLIANNLHKISHSHIFPVSLHKLLLFPAEMSDASDHYIFIWNFFFLFKTFTLIYAEVFVSFIKDIAIFFFFFFINVCKW